MSASMQSVEHAGGKPPRLAIAQVFMILFLLAFQLLFLNVDALADDTSNAQKLLALAKQRFGTLTTADEKLFRAVANAKPAVYAIRETEKDKTIAAERIAWLCTDKQAKEMVTHMGIQIDAARIEGNLELQNIDISFWLSFWGCTIPQGMNLQYASIRGLLLTKSQTGPISADGIKVAGGVFLTDGFRAEGGVRLLGAEIGGDLDCQNGQFRNPKGNALFADGIKVGGYIFLRNGFTAEGEVRLLDAEIGRDLDCENGQFSNPTGDVLIADGIKVAGSVFLRSGFKADGGISLAFADVGQGLACTGIQSVTSMTLDLRSAKVGTFSDDTASWPDGGKLYLDGFVYERLDDRAPRDAGSRIKWLRRQPAGQFLPQPYEQLAAVFKKEGLESDAKKILIAKEEDPARLSQLNPLECLWHYVSKWTICYGYHPEYAFLWALALVIVGCMVFASGRKHGLVAPTSESAYVVQPDSGVRQLTDTYPRFSSFFYSLDVFLPVIDLHQEKYWLPQAERGAVVGWLQWVQSLGLSAPTYGSLLRCYMWLQILVGWVLTSLFIAGLTRVVRS